MSLSKHHVSPTFPVCLISLSSIYHLSIYACFKNKYKTLSRLLYLYNHIIVIIINITYLIINIINFLIIFTPLSFSFTDIIIIHYLHLDIDLLSSLSTIISISYHLEKSNGFHLSCFTLFDAQIIFMFSRQCHINCLSI